MSFRATIGARNPSVDLLQAYLLGISRRFASRNDTNCLTPESAESARDLAPPACAPTGVFQAGAAHAACLFALLNLLNLHQVRTRSAEYPSTSFVAIL